MITTIAFIFITGCGGRSGNSLEPDGRGSDTSPAQIWYADIDGDGFGDPSVTIEAVRQPEGYVSNPSDCQDNDFAINPDADEICGDNVDQDCNDDDLVCPTDPEPTLTWYADVDKDGFGDFEQTIEAARQPMGYVSDHSDCQDSDPTIHPSATEICGDGIDQDCRDDDLLCDPEPILARFGIITDIHHSNRLDSTRRKYSAALSKAAYFVDTMRREGVDFIIELGDRVDTVVDGKDPIQNLDEIDDILRGFAGPLYHVLGNHEFDSIDRFTLLNHLENTGIPAGRTYYSFDLNGFHYIVLDADYTVAEPHEPFDMIKEGQIAWWHWTEAWVPQEQLDWLEADLVSSDLPTLIFSHQALLLDASVENAENFMINNAAAVRRILEADGQVLAAFSGHDHRGAITLQNNIHYFGLVGNVGLERAWAEVSSTNGLDSVADCPFSIVEIEKSHNDSINGVETYRLQLLGNAQQYSYDVEMQIAAP